MKSQLLLKRLKPRKDHLRSNLVDLPESSREAPEVASVVNSRLVLMILTVMDLNRRVREKTVHRNQEAVVPMADVNGSILAPQLLAQEETTLKKTSNKNPERRPSSQPSEVRLTSRALVAPSKMRRTVVKIEPMISQLLSEARMTRRRRRMKTARRVREKAPRLAVAAGADVEEAAGVALGLPRHSKMKMKALR